MDRICVVSTEYHTPTQNINPGSFADQYKIIPSTNANGATIDDTVIQSELTAQITAGNLPAPQLDSQGNPVTYYAIYFPNGKTITAGSDTSCVAGGFCAYHGTVAAADAVNEYFYGVHPYMQVGSGCDTGCGTGTTFQKNCQVSSHELVEMITGTKLSLD